MLASLLMELLTIIKCLAARGAAVCDPTHIGARSSCVLCTPDICTLYALLCTTIAPRVLHFSAILVLINFFNYWSICNHVPFVNKFHLLNLYILLIVCI